MAERVDEMVRPEVEQVKIMLNTLYLCIGYAVRHVAKHEGEEAALDLKRNMLETLKAGDIDMALLEDAKSFNLIVSKIEQLTWGDPIAERRN
jgi:hypothetical protein